LEYVQTRKLAEKGLTQETVDIFRHHAAAWRRANTGHVSLDQMKVMSAIEHCRTAALGGHVARCEGCAHTVIAYNSCRNRHCPKCQGTAAREWLAAREADLLPVPYFHVVFTLPAAIADIAYQNKAAIYDILFTTSAETMTTIAADPRHLGARIGITSVLHTWGSALTHHPHVHMIVPGGGISLDGTRWVSCRPDFILPVEVLSCLFRGLFLAKLVAAHRAGRLEFFGVHARLDDIRAFKAYLAPLRKSDWVVYAKRPFGGPLAVLAYLSRYTHRVAISNRRLVAADDGGVSFRWKDYRIEGPGRWKTMTLTPHEFIRRFLMHVLPCGSSLRPAGQRHPRRQHRPGARTARRPGQSRTARHNRDPGGRPNAHAAASVPLLRRAHVHHRDLRARLRAQAPTDTRAGGNRDRHLMMPSPPIRHRSDISHPRRISIGIASTRVGPSDSPASPAPFRSIPRSARLALQAHPRLRPKPWARPLRLILFEPEAALNSP
jgi:hypothetical protein